MAQNPYYVEPANVMPGLSAISTAFKNRGERELEESKAEKQKTKIQEGLKLLDSDADPSEIASFMVANPEMGKVVENALGYKSEQTKQNLLDTVKGIYTGEVDPAKGSIAHVESVIDAGGDPSHSLELAKTSTQDPEMGKQEAGRVWAATDPEGFAKYQKATGTTTAATTKKPTANMQDWEQYLKIKKEDPEQASLFASQVGINEAIGEEKATTLPAKIQNWNEYNRLKAIDPAQATLFASSVGIDESPDKGAFNFTDDEKDRMATEYAETGKFPMAGRNKEIYKLNAEIKKRSLEQQKAKGISDVTTLYNRLDKKGMQKDIDQQQGKFGSMRSFVLNIDKQAAKIAEVGKRMERFDTKFLNIPLNKVVDAVGSADRATFRLLVGELSEEVGKLASGATNSVAALPEGGREKWDRIFDTDLSYNDMMKLVEESKAIANMRVGSMKESLKTSREIIRKTPKSKKAAPQYNEGDTANGGKLIFTGGEWRDNA